MATIDKISAILNTEIKMPFKIKARESVHTGNPFKDSSFEGLTLPADVFESSTNAVKAESRAKMVMSAIVGSVSNFTKRITEPVSAFCNKVRNASSATWNYLKNTTVSDFGHQISSSITERVNSISERITTMKKNLELNKINEHMPVSELEALWAKELEVVA